MCGIAGLYSLIPQPAEAAIAELEAMARAIAHRGPDDQGAWCDADAGIGFSHRRLSIVDLSPLGHQPMTSVTGRYTITFNGEIYNYRAVREELASVGMIFRGGSDTEVLLAAIEHWGLMGAVQRCDGMFAFGLWDRHERALFLVRDRFGEKPLYFGQMGKVLLFGSELRALRAHRDWAAEIDRNALALLMRYDFIPAPHSIFMRVRKVIPGTIVEIRIRGAKFSFAEQRYWESRKVAEQQIAAPFAGSAQEAVGAVQGALEHSVRQQMVADVPVGAFLSGGIDSSLVVALMQRLGTRAAKTFSIGFAEQQFNEAPFARKIAEYLGTEHTELMVTPRDALDVIPKLPSIYDEPFADSSQIPTYLVSAMARQHVTVSLSGDAADELFGGYERYPNTLGQWQRSRGFLGRVQRGAGKALSEMPRWMIGALAAPARLSKRWRRDCGLADVVHDRTRRWQSNTLSELYKSHVSFCQSPADVVIGAVEPETVIDRRTEWPDHAEGLGLMMFIDACLYMPDDVLVKVDRAAMAVALETRVPFLDPTVAAMAWSMPTAMHFSDGRGKWILRQMLEKFVPLAMFERPKMGFAVPIAQWLKSELRPWAESLLDADRLRQEGYFNANLVRSRWQQHLAGTVDWSFNLWGMLMFQAWLEQWESATGLKSR